MSSNTTDQLISIFGLPRSEQLLDDVGCVLKRKLMLCPGRLFVFDHYLCFYSKNLNSKEKLVFQFKDIVRIKQAKSLGLIKNAIKIYLVDERKFFFKRIKNRDVFYHELIKLWFQQSPSAIIDDFHEIPLSEDDDDEILDMKVEVSKPQTLDSE